MGNPRPGEKSGEGIENPQSGTCISLLSDFLRKNPPFLQPCFVWKSGMGSEFRKDEKSRMHGGEGGEEIKKGFYFGKNTCQVQTSGAL